MLGCCAALGDEIQTNGLFRRAGPGKSTLTAIASYSNAPPTGPVTTFGTYDPGNGSKTPRVSIGNNDDQTINPVGTSSFQAGSLGNFGFYADFNGFGSTAFSQDARNVFDGGQKKLRVYSTPVTNRYVIAIEGETAAGALDFQDVVFVADNVRPATS